MKNKLFAPFPEIFINKETRQRLKIERKEMHEKLIYLKTTLRKNKKDIWQTTMRKEKSSLLRAFNETKRHGNVRGHPA